MEVATRLFLIRPPTQRGEHRIHREELPIDGALDLEPATAGLEGLAELFARLAQRKPSAVISSPRARSLHVARALALQCDLQVRMDPQFEPRGSGVWPGRPPANLGTAWPAFLADRRHSAAPDAEALDAHEQRVLAGLDRLAAEFSGREIVVVMHADGLRAALARALGLELSASFEPEPGQALALDWAHPAALEFKHSVIGMGVDWDVAKPATQVHKYPGGASLVPRS